MNCQGASDVWEARTRDRIAPAMTTLYVNDLTLSLFR